MVKRNADGSLKVVAQMPNDQWLRDGTPEARIKVIDETKSKGRFLTEDERAEILGSQSTE